MAGIALHLSAAGSAENVRVANGPEVRAEGSRGKEGRGRMTGFANMQPHEQALAVPPQHVGNGFQGTHPEESAQGSDMVLVEHLTLISPSKGEKEYHAHPREW